MKKFLLYISILLSVIFTSCLKDRTNMDIKEVSPIVIDTTGIASSFITFQLDSLKIKPKVTMGTSNLSTLKYEWSINAYGGYERIVGTKLNLATKIIEAPATTSYMLIYTVTDTLTNLKGFFSWNLKVNPVFGEGLIVADTKDGATTDLNLIMAYNFNTAKYDSLPKLFYNLYSDNNGAKIDGLVKSLTFMSYNTTKFVTLLTNKSILKLDPISYKLKLKDNDLFLLPPAAINPNMVQSIQLTNQHEYIVNDGKIHHRYGDNVLYGYAYLIDKTEYSCEKVCGIQQPSGAAGILYDEKNNRFLMLPSMTSSSNPLVAFPVVDNSTPAPAFDPQIMGNKTCLNLEEGQTKRVVAVMKTRDQSQYYVYQVIPTNPVNGKMGYSVHDISSTPEIALSKYYTCSTAENVLFYATDTKIYSLTLMVNGSSVSNVRYTVANGEKITGMKMHIRNGNMYLPSLTSPGDYSQRRTFASANRLVIISTYNETTKVGKIITIPLETLGVGGLVTDPAYIRTFTGFGKIVAFNFQGA
ncbi:MAG: PKD-like family lipoprotein [Prolixibacteraceae bacterium]